MKDTRTMPVLPVEAYTSQEWYDKEQQLIFGNSWQFAGLVEDIREPGDFITAQCGYQNILVIKGKDERLRAFHNLCMHRGAQLLRAAGKKQKTLTCPYHDWTYNLDGRLVGVPEKGKEFPNLDMKKVCLHRASVDIWRGMIWVHPKPDAQPVTDWFKACEGKLGPHDPSRLIEYPDTTYETTINANWKIVVENYIDVYHLSHLHSNTLQMYDHANAEFGFEGDHYLFREPLTKEYQDNLDSLMPLKRIREMTDEHIGAFAPWLFPNLGLAESEGAWSTFHLIPLGPDKTKVVSRTKTEEISGWEYYKRSIKSTASRKKHWGSKAKYESSDPDDPMASGDFMMEDIYACEQQQKSLKNPLFNVTETALYGESPVRGFQTIIERWMEEG